MRALLVITSWITTTLFFAGCSQYEGRWQNPPVTSGGKDRLEGSYVGTWQSGRYSAAGRLWCILTRKSPDEYVADFKATWHGIFSSRHTVTVRVTDRRRTADGTWARVRGQAAIRMWIGSGTYRCEGEIGPTGFHARYEASYDRGSFALQRAATSEGRLRN